MKKLLLPLFVCAVFSASAQNALLQGAVTGSVSTTGMADICIVSDGTDAVLVIGGATGAYAVDIADNNPADAAANTITSIPNFISSKLDPLAGQAVTVLDMQVNPISKSVYILGSGGANRYIFKVENNGANVTMVDLSNVTYSEIPWGGTFNVNDMVYGNGTLYVSTGTFTLDGSLAWIKPPFAHNTSFTKRSTTLFKSNWGGQYFTTAPLETLTLGEIDGKKRLMGVTTCAPGFSIDVATLSGSGLLTVTEDFNIHRGQSKDAIFQHHDGKDWLFDLHDSKLYRIGKKYLDGSQVTANEYDNSAVKLRDNLGNVSITLPAEEIKVMSASTLTAIAFWDNYKLLLLESGSAGALKLSQMSVEDAAGVNNVQSNVGLDIYPNPAKNKVTISVPAIAGDATITILSATGAVAATHNISNGKATIDVSSLASGVYAVKVQTDEGKVSSAKLTIE